MTEHLIAAATRLADVLSRENAALAALDLPRAVGLLAEKQAAAQAFSDLQATAGPAAADRRASMAPLVERLRALAAENQILLEQGLVVQTRVMGIIARAVRPSLATPCYQATGDWVDATRPTALTLSARV